MLSLFLKVVLWTESFNILQQHHYIFFISKVSMDYTRLKQTSSQVG